MRKTSEKKLTFDTCILLLLFCIGSINFVFLLKDFSGAIPIAQKSRIPIPGQEFADLAEYLKGVKTAGFLTDKDMSPERNDGQFLAAQYTLAPVVLDLNNPDHELVILDCISIPSAFDLMELTHRVPLFINPYGKILAKRK